jgi:hypothetical protein
MALIQLLAVPSRPALPLSRVSSRAQRGLRFAKPTAVEGPWVRLAGKQSLTLLCDITMPSFARPDSRGRVPLDKSEGSVKDKDILGGG